MSLKRAITAPDDLRHTNPAGPRARLSAWQVGDVVYTGGTRWIIRILTDETVELEASSAAAGIWWRTSIINLPEKAAA